MDETIVEEIKKTNEISYSWDMGTEAEELELREKQWKARTGLNEETLQGAIEALIFMSDKPLSIQKIKRAIDEDIPLRFVYDSIEKLQKVYGSADHGLKLMEVAEGYQFRTKIQYGKFIANIHKAPTITLSPLSLEVLAIIAFKQPISKMEVDQMRGVDSGHLIRGLMDKQLVKVIGRSNETGQPTSFGTSDEFLELFNVNTLDDLPSMNDLQELVEENSIGDIENIRELVKTEAEKFKFDDLSELDAIKESIRNIKADTNFTQMLKSNSKKKKEDELEESKTAFDILEECVSDEQPIAELEEGDIPQMPLELLESNEVVSSEENNSEVPLFDDSNELSEALENAFNLMQGRTEEFRAEELNSSEKLELTEENDDLDDLDGFEIADLSNIQEKLSDIEKSEKKDFS